MKPSEQLTILKSMLLNITADPNYDRAAVREIAQSIYVPKPPVPKPVTPWQPKKVTRISAKQLKLLTAPLVEPEGERNILGMDWKVAHWLRGEWACRGYPGIWRHDRYTIGALTMLSWDDIKCQYNVGAIKLAALVAAFNKAGLQTDTQYSEPIKKLIEQGEAAQLEAQIARDLAYAASSKAYDVRAKRVEEFKPALRAAGISCKLIRQMRDGEIDPEPFIASLPKEKQV